MTATDETLTKVELRLLDELLTYRAELATSAAGDAVRDSSSPRRQSWLESVLVAGIAVTLLALGIVVVTRVVSRFTSSALAATPEPLIYHPEGDGKSGRDVLLGLAAAAARAPAPPGSGRYAYVKTFGWYLDTQVSRSTATSAIVPTVSESWTAANGSARILRKTLKVSATGRRLGGIGPGATIDDFTVPASQSQPLPALSTSPNVVANQLDVGHPRSDGPVERFVALQDLALEEPIPPRVESAILRVLARSPGLINSGSVIDRLGRPGIAVSLDSAYSGLLTRYTLIFDRNGTLLGEEETLLGDPGKLNVRRAAVISYTVFAASGRVNNTTSRP